MWDFLTDWDANEEIKMYLQLGYTPDVTADAIMTH
jgi:hypothetical protein